MSKLNAQVTIGRSESPSLFGKGSTKNVYAEGYSTRDDYIYCLARDRPDCFLHLGKDLVDRLSEYNVNECSIAPGELFDLDRNKVTYTVSLSELEIVKSKLEEAGIGVKMEAELPDRLYDAFKDTPFIPKKMRKLVSKKRKK